MKRASHVRYANYKKKRQDSIRFTAVTITAFIYIPSYLSIYTPLFSLLIKRSDRPALLVGMGYMEHVYTILFGATWASGVLELYMGGLGLE